jgi:hypothetical protein
MSAFPTISFDSLGQITSFDGGMKLRDYFAGQVIVGFLANNKTDYSSNLIVKLAYEMADEMMKAREITNGK